MYRTVVAVYSRLPDAPVLRRELEDSGVPPSQIHISWGHHDIWPTTDYFGADDAALIWWNPDAKGVDELGNDGTGLWEFADGGKRYLPGDWPHTAPALFQPRTSVTGFDTFPPGEGPPSYPSPAR